MASKNNNSQEKTFKKVALAKTLAGVSKAEIYSELRKESKLPTSDLANLIQAIPSKQLRNKYKGLNTFLILLVVVSMILKMFEGLQTILLENMASGIAMLLITVSIHLFLLIGIATYKKDRHKWLAWISCLGFLRLVIYLTQTEFELANIFDILFMGSMIFLGFYLNQRFFPEVDIKTKAYYDEFGQKHWKQVVNFVE